MSTSVVSEVVHVDLARVVISHDICPTLVTRPTGVGFFLYVTGLDREGFFQHRETCVSYKIMACLVPILPLDEAQA